MANFGTVVSVVRTALNRVFKGKRLDPFTGKSLFSVKKHNEVVACINPLLNISAKMVFNNGGAFQSSDAKVEYSDANVMIQFDGSQIILQATGTSGMNYRGEYNNANAYSVGDVVRKRSGSDQGVWVCVVAQGAGGSAPAFPEPADSGGTNNWELIGPPINQFTACQGGSDQTFYWGGWQP
jgi:hypothetical protein